MRSKDLITVGTSFGPSGYDQYGQRFILSFLEYWPETIKLVVAYDGKIEGLIEDPRITYIALDDHTDFIRFRDATSNPTHRGKLKRACDKWSTKASEAGYNFRFDAHKFGKKVLGMYKAYMASKHRYFIWLDADSVTIKSIPHEFIASLFIPSKSVTRLYRGTGYHSECGFIGFDTLQYSARLLLFCLKQVYIEGAFVKYAEWHDSYLFDRLIEELGVSTYDLPHTSNGHPFVNSCLGVYMDHLKGDKRKERGASFTEDYTE